MADIGFDFRDTQGFVTDPTGNTYVLDGGTTLYPTTRAGYTFGWDAGPAGADRSAAVNARVAGINYASGVLRTFQVDLPAAGNYNIGVAIGDQAGAQNNQNFTIYDNTTSLLAKGPTNTGAANHYMDAGGTVRTSDSDWFSNQTFASLTFATTTFKIAIDASGGGVDCIAHLDINAAAAAAARASTLAMMGVG